MATQKKTTSSPNSSYEMPRIKSDMVLKEGGETYTTLKDWDMPGKMGVLFAGGRFVECADGFYQVFDNTGKRGHFAVSKSVLQTIKDKDNQ